MDRYALIHTKMPREFVLLQGTGCRWKKCTFCDYHDDVSEHPFSINEPVLRQVTGQYGVLDVINSGSAMELDSETIALIKEVVKEKTKGKKLWVRTIGSSAVAYWFDSLPFVLIAFLGVVSTHDLLMMIAFQYGAKLAIEAFFGTPMAYAAVHAIRRFVDKRG